MSAWPRAGESTGELAAAAARAYTERHGRTPKGVWFAPGRVNLIGEHTDYNQGFVLPFALGAGVAVAAGSRRDGLFALWSRQSGGTATPAIAELRPGSITGWAAYALGMPWALREAGYEIGGANITIDSDLPMGAGLSSSAALECAVGLALTELYGLSLPRAELARIASRAENEFAGAPTGIMDQSATLLCRAGSALLLDCQTGETAALPLDPGASELCFLVIDTRARHELTDGRYAIRRSSCETAARNLGVASLRDVSDKPRCIARIGDPVLRRRARHVVTENRSVKASWQTSALCSQARTPPSGTTSRFPGPKLTLP